MPTIGGSDAAPERGPGELTHECTKGPDSDVHSGASVSGQGVGLGTSTAERMASIPSSATESPHPSRHSQSINNFKSLKKNVHSGFPILPGN